MFRRLAVVAVGAALLSAPSVVSAQLTCVGVATCSLTPTASLTIPKVVRLAVSTTSIALNTVDFATDSLDGQDEVTTFGGISVRANHPWTINLSSAAAAWTYTPAAGASGGARVREDLLFQANCAGAWIPLSATAAAVASGALTNGATADVCLSTNFPNDYTNVKNRPGTYSLAMTLTLAAN
ncbi:MAG TPA: hypothetical protein VM764_09755 [Gemmatimonadaceae bacterium]|jgi:hypothetical protein|nr:hypothetical protein [Gemmatimonadaceae bacterium]